MINSVSFLGNITYNINRQTSFGNKTKPMENDCFVRSSKSQAPSQNDFIQWAEKTNFFPQKLSEVMQDEENILGKGFSNTVYKIPGNEEYVLRVSNSSDTNFFSDLSDYSLEDAEDKNLKGNYGQCVAKIKSSDFRKPEIFILKKQKGITNGNPPSSVIYFENGTLRPGELPYEARERKEHYAKCLQILADMPQESYDELVHNLSELGEAGYRFDYYNPNNFLLDEEGGKINIIDLEKTQKGSKNDLGNALWALSNISYLTTFMSKHDNSPMPEEESNKAFENTMTVIDKYTKAMKNNGEKYSPDGYEFFQLMNSLPMSFYLRSMNIEEKRQKMVDMGVMD